MATCVETSKSEEQNTAVTANNSVQIDDCNNCSDETTIKIIFCLIASAALIIALILTSHSLWN